MKKNEHSKIDRKIVEELLPSFSILKIIDNQDSADQNDNKIKHEISTNKKKVITNNKKIHGKKNQPLLVKHEDSCQQVDKRIKKEARVSKKREIRINSNTDSKINKIANETPCSKTSSVCRENSYNQISDKIREEEIIVSNDLKNDNLPNEDISSISSSVAHEDSCQQADERINQEEEVSKKTEIEIVNNSEINNLTNEQNCSLESSVSHEDSCNQTDDRIKEEETNVSNNLKSEKLINEEITSKSSSVTNEDSCQQADNNINQEAEVSMKGEIEIDSSSNRNQVTHEIPCPKISSVDRKDSCNQTDDTIKEEIHVNDNLKSEKLINEEINSKSSSVTNEESCRNEEVEVSKKGETIIANNSNINELTNEQTCSLTSSVGQECLCKQAVVDTIDEKEEAQEIKKEEIDEKQKDKRLCEFDLEVNKILNFYKSIASKEIQTNSRNDDSKTMTQSTDQNQQSCLVEDVAEITKSVAQNDLTVNTIKIDEIFENKLKDNDQVNSYCKKLTFNKINYSLLFKNHKKSDSQNDVESLKDVDLIIENETCETVDKIDEKEETIITDLKEYKTSLISSESTSAETKIDENFILFEEQVNKILDYYKSINNSEIQKNNDDSLIECQEDKSKCQTQSNTIQKQGDQIVSIFFFLLLILLINEY